jgi:hypothetical protein
MKDDSIKIYLGHTKPDGVVLDGDSPLEKFMGETLMRDIYGYFIQKHMWLGSFAPLEGVEASHYEIRTNHTPACISHTVGVYRSGEAQCEVFNKDVDGNQFIIGKSKSWADLYTLVMFIKNGSVTVPAYSREEKQYDPRQFATYLGFWTRLRRRIASILKASGNTPAD